MPTDEEAEFQMVTILEPQIPDCPPLGFISLDNSASSPWESDISDSCPASPSPLSSPSPRSSASSSESGIEDGSDMEEATSAFSQTANRPLVVKMEDPSSPLNAWNQRQVNSNVPKKRRKSSKSTPNDNSAWGELNKLLMETRVSLASALMDHSVSQIYQTTAQISDHDDAMAGVQTTVSSTPVSHSCPQSVKASQITTLTPNSHPVLVSSQSTSTVTVPKPSTPAPVASPSRIKNKNTRNPRKTDEPKIVIIEEPEEVFPLDISENLLNYSVLIISVKQIEVNILITLTSNFIMFNIEEKYLLLFFFQSTLLFFQFDSLM